LQKIINAIIKMCFNKTTQSINRLVKYTENSSFVLLINNYILGINYA